MALLAGSALSALIQGDLDKTHLLIVFEHMARDIAAHAVQFVVH
jgi:hypothetical protein